MARYLVPRHRTRVEAKVSNSRFIGTIAPAATVKEAQAFIREMRAEMPDATHHVYAFKIGYGASVSEGLSDDGEPSGTAGPPAMAVVRGSGVGDVVLVITRYFGGTKLGTGGLVSAYTQCAKDAFAALETEEKVHRVAMQLTADYRYVEMIHRTLADAEAMIDHEQYEEKVTIRFRIPEEHLDWLTTRMMDLTAGACQPQRIERTNP
jgi:uncharacterized YigZ family protein